MNRFYPERMLPVNRVNIRRLKIQDADDIGAIYADITQAPVGIDFKKIIKEQAGRKEDASFVAELDGKIVGFMVSNILSNVFGVEKSARITTLGVAPAFMGQGIGEKLAEKIFSHYKAMNIDTVFTSVEWDSTDLLSFFKTLGFDRSNFINLRKKL
jgi:ribosomal protein S18 acetylase RimI-like enzyme